MYEDNSIWTRKGATLSDKSARQEFGLTQQEIIAAIRAGKLQFRESNMHGNPWFRLLRHEIESLVKERSGQEHLQEKKLQKELADIKKETRKLKTQLATLERRRAVLEKELEG
jgi:septal ring factor EnvC (AmiA/AmiB activator)